MGEFDYATISNTDGIRIRFLSSDDLQNSNENIILRRWNFVFVIFSYALSFVSAYAAVRLLDHTSWRNDKEKENASSIFISHPNIVASILLGFGTVWSMHFIGTSAVTLDRVPFCFDWRLTVLSLAFAVSFMYAGVYVVTKYDYFAGSDRLEKLKFVIINDRKGRGIACTEEKNRNKSQFAIHLTAFFHRPLFVIAGGILAAIGAFLMHYSGMMAMQGPFIKQWKVSMIITSFVLDIFVCCAGFFIIFRILHWKVEQFWLRPVGAAVIALAVSSMHYIGEHSVRYIKDDDNILAQHQHVCDHIIEGHQQSPNAWTTHQVVVVTIALVTPCFTIWVESSICRELVKAYSNLKNPSFNAVSGASSQQTNSHDFKILTKNHLPSNSSEERKTTVMFATTNDDFDLCVAANQSTKSDSLPRSLGPKQSSLKSVLKYSSCNDFNTLPNRSALDTSNHGRKSIIDADDMEKKYNDIVNSFASASVMDFSEQNYDRSVPRAA